MKKLLFCAALMCAAMFSSCGNEYDDTALRKEMESIKDRVAALEERLTQEVNTLKGLIEAAEEGLAVSVEETADGYEVTIGDGEPITIYHGKDGENGTDGTNGTQITVVEVDGVYYWAINGEATDYRVTGNDGEDGEDGEDGYTPEIKDGKWYINGEEVGPATGENGEDGDSFFKDVTVNDDDTVTFTLADDTTITVALAKSAKYTDVQSIKFVPEYEDGKVTVGYYTGAEDAFVVAKYEVTPKAAAATIAKYAKDASMQAVYTKTRAEAGELVELPVTAIEAEEGIITVTATAADLAEEFFAGTLSASIRFAVQDDLSGNASEYVAAVAAKAELPAMEVAAVAEGYQAAKLTWSEVAGAAYYQIKAGADVVAKAEGVTEFVVEKLTAANNYAFTVEACTSADKVLTSGSTEEISIWTLTNTPELNLTFENNVLKVTNRVDLTAVCLEIEVRFMKDGQAAYTAKGLYSDYELTDLDTNIITDQKFKFGAFDEFTKWRWNGAAEVGETPEFEAGTYTIEYTAQYYPIINAIWGKQTDPKTDKASADRITYPTPECVLRTLVAREGTTDITFTVEQTYKLNAQATIDDGTDEIRKLFTSWPGNPPSSFATYDWYGLRSKNGQFETVNLAWDAIEEADKIVVEYLDQEVEVVTGLPFHIVSGLKTSPVDFTITAYQGKTVLVSEKVSSDVYTLPEAAAGTFNAVYSAEKGGWNLIGENFNTNQYATWSCSFNLYEKGSDTPVFENPITKNGDNNNYNYLAWACQGEVETSLNNHAAFKVNDGDFEWDNGKVFTGLKGNTEYEVRFELNVWPFIYDAANAGNNDKTYMYKKVLMGSEKANGFGAIKLPGTYTFTTGEGPAAFEVIAAINDGTERMQTQYTDGHRGFKAINGIYEGAKLSWAANDAIAKVVIKYNDGTADQTKTVTASEWTATDKRVSYTVEGIKAHKATFAVEAFNSNDISLGATEVETDIYHLATPELVFTPSKQEDGEWKLDMSQMSNGYNSFYSVTFNIYKDGVALFETPLAKNVDGLSTGTITTWAGNRGCNSWLSTNDYDGGIKTFAADKFDYATEYEVRYTLTAWPTIPDAKAQAENFHGSATSATWFYWSSILFETQTVAEVSTTFTTEAAPAPAFDLAGTWAADYTNFSSTNAMYNTAHSGNPAFTFIKLASENNKKPADGQKYYAQYKRYTDQDIYFDIDSKEIDGKPGCYAIINLIDREAGIDKVTNNNSYYDSNEDTIYIDFVTEASGSPGTTNSEGDVPLGDYTVAGYLWTAKMTR